jgi:hypothetical protein
MQGPVDVPRNCLREFFREPGQPETQPFVARAVADDQQATGRNARRQMREQRLLFRHRQIVQHIEESDVSAKFRERVLRILMTKFDIVVRRFRDPRTLSDFSRVHINSQDRLAASAFPQIKRQQPDTASHIEDRLRGRTQQLPRGRINFIPPQLPAHIAAKPRLREASSDARTRIFVISRVSSQGFHLLRIIALPD